jgi:hypothetical protein
MYAVVQLEEHDEPGGYPLNRPSDSPGRPIHDLPLYWGSILQVGARGPRLCRSVPLIPSGTPAGVKTWVRCLPADPDASLGL